MAVDQDKLDATGVPRAIPVSNQWSNWTEFCLMGDLEELACCPTCAKVIPDGFMMFRPHGLEFWRCLSCLARTNHISPLFAERTTTTGV